MMNMESVLMEIIAGMVIIPWCVFITASIFSLRQQVALLKVEIDLLKRIEEIVSMKSRL